MTPPQGQTLRSPIRGGYRYKAFISYNRKADRPLAEALELALEGYPRPWPRLRAFRIFRDDSDSDLAHGLSEKVNQALSQSEKLILLASPESARSRWVKHELSWWFKHRAVADLIIVQTAGVLVWSRAARNFSSSSTALPRLRAGRFAREPHWLDLSWAREALPAAAAPPEFHIGMRQLMATLLGRPPEEIDIEVAKVRRRNRLAAAGVALALLLISAIAGKFLYDQQISNAKLVWQQAIERAQGGLYTEAVALAEPILHRLPDDGIEYRDLIAQWRIRTQTWEEVVARSPSWSLFRWQNEYFFKRNDDAVPIDVEAIDSCAWEPATRRLLVTDGENRLLAFTAEGGAVAAASDPMRGYALGDSFHALGQDQYLVFGSTNHQGGAGTQTNVMALISFAGHVQTVLELPWYLPQEPAIDKDCKSVLLNLEVDPNTGSALPDNSVWIVSMGFDLNGRLPVVRAREGDQLGRINLRDIWNGSASNPCEISQLPVPTFRSGERTHWCEIPTFGPDREGEQMILEDD